MKKEEMAKKNLDLLAEFMKYAFDNPDILDQIPPHARLIILPENDPELYKENMKLVQSCRKESAPIVVFRMELPKPVIPHLEEVKT